jgi:hypothetical protein
MSTICGGCGNHISEPSDAIECDNELHPMPVYYHKECGQDNKYLCGCEYVLGCPTCKNYTEYSCCLVNILTVCPGCEQHIDLTDQLLSCNWTLGNHLRGCGRYFHKRCGRTAKCGCGREHNNVCPGCHVYANTCCYWNE